MKSLKTILLAGLLSALALSPAARADGRWEGRGGWGHHRHEHHHGPWHHHGPHRGHVVIRERPIYYPPPPPRVIHRYYDYGPPAVYPRPQVYGYGGYGGPLPIIAGGVLGGVVGEQLGRGDHAAIIGGSVLGSVLGNEIAR